MPTSAYGLIRIDRLAEVRAAVTLAGQMPTSLNETAEQLSGPGVGEREGVPIRLSVNGQCWLAFSLVLFGSALIVGNTPVAELLARGLPWRAEVASAGTNVPSFALIAPTIVWRSGIVAVVGGGVLWLGTWVQGPRRLRQDQVGRFAAFTVIVATGFWYGWLSYPHNAFPSNARFHWVDYLTYDSDNFFYAAGRLPHMIFYEAPHLWQGITAAAVAGLCYIIARQLGLSTLVAAATAGIPAVAGNMLLFANTAEDVMLTFVLLLGVIAASLTRRPVIVGVALAAAVLGRPSFILFTGCMVAAEVVRGLRHGGTLRAVDWRYTTVASTTALGLTVVAQMVFTILGARYFLVDGRLINTAVWDEVVRREIDGFTIFPFSGVYLLHFLWVIPVVLIGGAVIGLVGARNQVRTIETTIYLSTLSIATHLLLHEATPVLYYNVRYLTYTLPFILFLALASLAHPRFPRSKGVLATAVVLVVLGTAVLPSGAVDLKRAVEARPDHELLEVQDYLRAYVGDRRVYLDYGGQSSRNYLAYVLRGNVNRIRLLGDSSPEMGSIVVSMSGDPWSTGEPVIETDSFLVFDTSVTGPQDG